MSINYVSEAAKKTIDATIERRELFSDVPTRLFQTLKPRDGKESTTSHDIFNQQLERTKNLIDSIKHQRERMNERVLRELEGEDIDAAELLWKKKNEISKDRLINERVAGELISTDIRIGAPGKSTLLHEMTSLNMIDEVRKILSATTDKSCRDPNGSTAVHIAAQEGHEAILIELVGAGIPLTVRDREGKTALHRAVEFGRSYLTDVFVRLGADMNECDAKGRTALHMACEQASSAQLEALLSCEAVDVESIDQRGYAPLHSAVERGNDVALRFLLSRGANVNVAGMNGITGLMIAAHKDRIHCLKTLLNWGADPKVRDKMGRSALVYAILRDCEAAVAILAKQTPIVADELIDNSDILALTSDIDGISTHIEDINTSQQFQRKESPELNLTSPVKLDKRFLKIGQTDSQLPATSLHKDGTSDTISSSQFLQKTQAERLKSFLQSDRAIRKGLGRNILHLAAVLGCSNIIRVLLRDSINRNNTFQDAVGITPLHLAVAADQQASVCELISCGAQKEVRTFANSESPVHFAVRHDLEDMFALLSSLGCDMNSRRIVNSQTPLIHAACSSKHNAMRALIELKKKNPQAKNNNVHDSTGSQSLFSNRNREGYNSLEPGAVEDPSNFVRLDAQDANGDTALHHAVRKRDVDAVRLLCRGGANPLIANLNGENPIANAVDAGNTKILKNLITAAGCAVDELPLDGRGFSLVQRAVIRGELSVVSVFLSMGVTNEICHQSMGLYELACMFGHDNLKHALCKKPFSNSLGLKVGVDFLKSEDIISPPELHSNFRPNNAGKTKVSLVFNLFKTITRVSPKIESIQINAVNITAYLKDCVQTLDSLTLMEESSLIEHLHTVWESFLTIKKIKPSTSNDSFHNDNIDESTINSTSSNNPPQLKSDFPSSNNTSFDVSKLLNVPLDIFSNCEVAVHHVFTPPSFFIPSHNDMPPPLRVSDSLLPFLPDIVNVSSSPALPKTPDRNISYSPIQNTSKKETDGNSPSNGRPQRMISAAKQTCESTPSLIQSQNFRSLKNSENPFQNNPTLASQYPPSNVRQVWRINPESLIQKITLPISKEEYNPAAAIPVIGMARKGNSPTKSASTLTPNKIPQKGGTGVLRKGIYAARILGSNAGGSSWGPICLFEIKFN